MYFEIRIGCGCAVGCWVADENSTSKSGLTSIPAGPGRHEPIPERPRGGDPPVPPHPSRMERPPLSSSLSTASGTACRCEFLFESGEMGEREDEREMTFFFWDPFVRLLIFTVPICSLV